MNSAQRAELLRKRFRALGGVPYKPTGSNRPRIEPPRGNGYQLRPFPAKPHKHRVGWVSQADDRTFETLPEHHRQGKPALIEIAKKTPKKLLRDEGKLKRYKL